MDRQTDKRTDTGNCVTSWVELTKYIVIYIANTRDIRDSVNMQAVLTDISTGQANYPRDSDLFAFKHLPHTDQVVPHSTGENVVVEFRYIVIINTIMSLINIIITSATLSLLSPQ